MKVPAHVPAAAVSRRADRLGSRAVEIGGPSGSWFHWHDLRCLFSTRLIVILQIKHVRTGLILLAMTVLWYCPQWANVGPGQYHSTVMASRSHWGLPRLRRLRLGLCSLVTVLPNWPGPQSRCLKRRMGPKVSCSSESVPKSRALCTPVNKISSRPAQALIA
jgi:hypothetical protein